MTTATLTNTGFNFGTRIADMIVRIKTVRARAAEYQRTYSELQHLSNRELDDIGVRRCDIADIAHRHVYCS
ncbi:DUF1127 domain-containing protein [uncultured Ruegeria sp.]|uniref:DUF1127 domain-containing protein n=1 Tax=uncultured Ruegeria sp. TaxID=259304 RepID=UPI0026208A57|nr:DUF1127 domain-containing protein [uncultured Ruegeria sp.]